MLQPALSRPPHTPAVTTPTPAMTPSSPPAFLPCADGARLGLGGAALGNLYQVVPETEAMGLLHLAWEDGCRSFDTAPHYGHGRSEHRMGHALEDKPRSSFRLSSKVGRLLTHDPSAPREQHGYVDTLPYRQHWDFSAAGIRQSVEQSLIRLGLDRLDAVFIHDMDAHTQGQCAESVFRQVLDHSLPELHRLKSEGLVRHIGLGVNDHAIVERTLSHADLDALLLAGRYTLLDTSAWPSLLNRLAQRRVEVSIGGVFNSGMLASRIDPSRPLTFNYAPAQAHWVDKALGIQAVCDRHGVPIPAAALQFALHHPAVHLVWLGARSTSEWLQARAAARHDIPKALWAELKHLGLLEAEVPTP